MDDLFRLSRNGEWIEFWRDNRPEWKQNKGGEWIGLAEFAGFVTMDRKQMIVAALNGNSPLRDDWNEEPRR